MRNIFIILFLFICFSKSNAQFIISADTSVCVGSELTIEAAGANSIASLVNRDDVHSDILDIGFDFNFYGNTYNQCLLSANGYLTFDLDEALEFSPWTYNAALPNPNNIPENAILAPWHDIDASISGDIIFGNFGVAPNRVFYVVWCNIPMYQCNNLISGQYILLFESSNNIEMHIDSKPICAGWSGGTAIQGTVNDNSTLFDIVDDPISGQPRNFPLQWQADEEGWRFVPNDNSTSFDITQIPYQPITTGSVTWLDQFGNVLSNDLSADITLDLIGDNYFYISIEDVCSGNSIENADSVLIQVAPLTNAGSDSTFFLCDSDSIKNLNDFLSGGFEAGGQWFSPSQENISNFLDPSDAESGIYSYITFGLSQNCNDTSFFDITIDELLNPGLEAYRLVCSADPLFSLFNELNGNPDVGGIWINPDGNVVPDIFNPLTSLIGEYMYVIEEINACPAQSQKVNISYQETFEIDVFSQSVTCPGEQDGSILIVPEPSTVTPISYSINNGIEYVDYGQFNNLNFGEYSVLVKDGNGCVTDELIVIDSSEDPIEVFISSSNVLCPDDEFGKVFIDTIVGGDSLEPFVYNWYSSESNEPIGYSDTLNVPSGGYYLIVQQGNCVGTDQTNVEDYNAISYDVVKSEISCFGSEDGAISVDVNGGGTAPFTYSWITNGGISSPSLFNLAAGFYSLEIVDFNNCVSTVDVELTSPSAPLSIENAVSNVSCFDSPTGSIDVIVVGGTPPYTYQWSSGHVTSFVDGLSAGLYEVLIKDSRNCQFIDTIEVDQSSQIISTISTQDVSCYDGFDGQASVIQTVGGAGNYSYTWSNGFLSPTISNLYFGDYTLITEDQSGCFVIDTVLINQPPDIKIELSSSDVLCFGDSTGSISANVSGGTPFNNGFYNYQWQLNNQNIGFNFPTLNNLKSSQYPYQIIVSDLNGCSSTAYAFVSEPVKLTLDTSEIINAYCESVSTGSISVVANGGFLNTNSSYQFYWSNGAEGSLIIDQNSGNYTAYVLDDNQCVDSLNLDILLIPSFNSTISSDSLECFDNSSGQAEISVSGGYGPYTYSWYFNNQVEQISSNNNTNVKASLSAGSVSVVVEDVNGCTTTNQINVEEPSQLFYTSIKDNDESCSGNSSSCDGQISILASGGSGQYIYNCFDLSDNLIANIVSSSNFVSFNDLCHGFYQFVVSDDKGCIAEESGNGQAIIEIISGYDVNSSIDLNSVTNNIVCYGDTSAFASVLNPNPLFSYNWNLNGEFYSTGLQANLPSGIITLDASFQSCISTSSQLTIDQPSPTLINSSVSNVLCNGLLNGEITVEAINPQGLSYNWSTGATTPSASQLGVGNYVLSITNTFDCTTNFDFVVEEPSEINVISSVTAVSCNGDNDGTANLSVSGGVSPYEINWLNLDPLNLPAGFHNVVVTDNNSCVDTFVVEIDQPTPVVANFISNVIPFNAAASGGTPGYSYQWLYFGSTVGDNQSFDPNEFGEYTLVVTDANDCQGRVNGEYLVEPVSISEINRNHFNIFPNPVTSQLTIVSNKNEVDVYQLKLIDSRGRLLIETSFKKQIVLDRSDLSAGIYSLFLNSKNGQIIEKIIISDSLE